MMNKKLNVWGRECDLEVIFDVYRGEEILKNQYDALDAFMRASDSALSTCEELKQYCLKQDGRQIGTSIENIFEYVTPKSIFVRRNEDKRCVVVLCDYKYDEEHGIALSFENEKLEHIGMQDDI